MTNTLKKFQTTKHNPTKRFYQELFAPIVEPIHRAVFHYFLLRLSPAYLGMHKPDHHDRVDEAFNNMEYEVKKFVKEYTQKKSLEITEENHRKEIQYINQKTLDKLYHFKNEVVAKFIFVLTRAEYKFLPPNDSIEHFGKNHIQSFSYFLRAFTASECLFFYGKSEYDLLGWPFDRLKVSQTNKLLFKSIDVQSLSFTNMQIMYSHLKGVLEGVESNEVQAFNFDLKKPYHKNLVAFDAYIQKKFSKSVYTVSREHLEDVFAQDIESMHIVDFEDTKTGLDVIWIDTGTAYIDDNKLKGGTCGTIYGLHEQADDQCTFFMCFLKPKNKDMFTPIIWLTYSPKYKVGLECRGVANNLPNEDHHRYLIPLFEKRYIDQYPHDKNGKNSFLFNGMCGLYYYNIDSNLDFINQYNCDQEVLKYILEKRPDLLSNKIKDQYRDLMLTKISIEDAVKDYIKTEGRDSPSKDWLIKIIKGESCNDHYDDNDVNYEYFLENELDKTSFKNVEVTFKKFYKSMTEELEELKEHYYSAYYAALGSAYNDEIHKLVLNEVTNYFDENYNAQFSLNWDSNDDDERVYIDWLYGSDIKNLSSYREFLVGLSRKCNSGDSSEEYDVKNFYSFTDNVYADEKNVLSNFKELVDYDEFVEELKAIGDKYLKEIS